MRRLLLWLPLSLLALVAAGLAAAVLLRTELAEAALSELLARRGFPKAELTVAGLTAERLEITDIDLGDQAPRAARIAVHYRPRALLAGKLQRVEVDGPSLVIDLRRDRPLSRLQGLLAGGDGGTAETAERPRRLPADLPSVLLRNAAVTVIGPESALLMSLSGRLDRRDGELRGLLRGRARTPHTTADVSLDARRLASDPALSFEVTGESELARLPLPPDLPARPTAGTARFALDGTAQLPPAGTPLTPAALLNQSARLTADIELEQSAAGELARGLAGTARLHAAVDGGSLVLRLLEPLELTAETLDRDRLAGLGLPAEAAGQAARLRRVTLLPWTGGQELVELEAAPAGDGPAAFRWTGRASLNLDLDGGTRWRLQASGTGTLDHALAPLALRSETLDLAADRPAYGDHRAERLAFVGGAEAAGGRLELTGTLNARDLTLAGGGPGRAGIELSAPVELTHEDGTTRLRLTDPGRIALPELPDTRPLRIDTPLALDVRALTLTSGDGRLQGSARVDPGELTGTLLRQDAADAPLAVRPGPVALSLDGTAPLKATASFEGGQLALPFFDLSAQAVQAQLRWGAGNPVANVTLGRVVHGATPAAFAPALLWAKLLSTEDQGWRVVGDLIPRGTDVVVPFTATTDPGGRRGQARLGPTEITFARGGLQPGRLSPVLGRTLEQAEGTFKASGDIAWTPAGLTSDGWLELAELDATTPQVTVEGLSGTLRFDRLWPPRTPPSQRLTAARVAAGVPLTEVAADFALDWDGEPVLQLDRAGGTLAGGQVFLRDETLRPLARRNRITLQVRELSLERLVALLAVEGLRAEGVVAGAVPVAFGPAGFEVDQGKLAAIEAGRIQVDLGQTSETLARQGRQVRLMVQALKDFRYDELALTLNRPADGALTLGVTMQGQNPDVLEGYPFRFNINLSGDLEPILAALQKGRRLTSDLLQRALERRGLEGAPQ